MFSGSVSFSLKKWPTINFLYNKLHKKTDNYKDKILLNGNMIHRKRKVYELLH